MKVNHISVGNNGCIGCLINNSDIMIRLSDVMSYNLPTFYLDNEQAEYLIGLLKESVEFNKVNPVDEEIKDKFK
jgi:hypothetical protein